MKKVLIKVTATIFIFLFSGMISNIYSEEWIEKVVVDKKFDISTNAKLIIDHEYGNVRCVNWDQNKIAVKVTVRVKTDDEKLAAKIISKINIDVDGSSNKVEAYCDLNQKLNGNGQLQVSIDFDIYMPSAVNFELEQKFGNTYIQSVSGSSIISVEYGNLEIVDLSNTENQLEVKFGEANIERINNGDIEISYSQFKLENSNIISVESEYSDISINKAQSISLELEGGNTNVGEVEKLDSETTFSNLEIQKLTGSLIAQTEYGNLNIGNVAKNFSSIIINNEYGGVSVNIDKDANYSFDANGEYGVISYPEKKFNSSYKKVSQSSTIVKGIVGNSTNPKSSVKIDSEYGSVDISAK